MHIKSGTYNSLTIIFATPFTKRQSRRTQACMGVPNEMTSFRQQVPGYEVHTAFNENVPLLSRGRAPRIVGMIGLAPKYLRLIEEGVHVDLLTVVEVRR